MTVSATLDLVRKIVDILIVWLVLYYILKSLRKNVKMVLLFKGIFFIIILKLVSSFFGLTTIDYLLNYMIEWGILALIVIFQPEIRNVLEQLGRSQLLGRHKVLTVDEREKVVYTFIKEFKKGNAFKGLYLSGNFGSGKSYIVSAMINELVKDGFTAALVYYPEFLRILKSSFKTDFDEQFDYARKVDLLLLDDIGAENLTSWSRDEILGPILQYRMDNKLATFFTSNLSIEELEVHLSEGKESIDKLKAKRIIERIRFLTEDLKLISKNQRK